jgi:hypothetical protein
LLIGETGVDAVAVSIQLAPLLRRHSHVRGFGHSAKAVAPMVEIDLQCGRPDQCGQLTGRHPAHQVHLEEAFLRVHVTQRVADVASVAALDSDGAVGVATDADGVGQSGQMTFAIERGATAGQQPPRNRHHQQQQG